MKKLALYLALLVGFTIPCFSSLPPGPPKGFKFEFVADDTVTLNGKKHVLGWLEIPELSGEKKKEVYIRLELGRQTPAFDKATGSVNFVYTPADKSVKGSLEMPAGLYSWRVTNKSGSKTNKTSHRPEDEKYNHKPLDHGFAWATSDEVAWDSIVLRRGWVGIAHERHPSAFFDGLLFKHNAFEFVTGAKESWNYKYQNKLDGVTGTFEIKQIGELRKEVDKGSRPSDQKGYFVVIEDDPAKIGTEDIHEASDTRRLHGDRKNIGSTLQIASNLNCLEGGVFSGGLQTMLHGPVQGQEAAIACMPAAIYRRYRPPYHERPVNLLENLAWLSVGNDGQIENFDAHSVPKASKIPDELENTMVGIHSKARVIGGYHPTKADWHSDPNKDEEFEYSTLIVDPEHTVTQVLTAALSLSGGMGQYYRGEASNAPINPEQVEALAKLLLNSSYEGTLLAGIRNAQMGGSRNVFLTMVGSGAFQNNLEWIADAIERMKPIIIEHRLKVHLAYRVKPNTPGSAEFYKRMKNLENEINTEKGMAVPLGILGHFQRTTLPAGPPTFNGAGVGRSLWNRRHALATAALLAITAGIVYKTRAAPRLKRYLIGSQAD